MKNEAAVVPSLERHREHIEYHREIEAATIRILKARAAVWQSVSFLMLWFTLWFAAAIAAVGLKLSQYLWQAWVPAF